jgi:hypothetical protein
MEQETECGLFLANLLKTRRKKTERRPERRWQKEKARADAKIYTLPNRKEAPQPLQRDVCSRPLQTRTRAILLVRPGSASGNGFVTAGGNVTSQT